MQNGDYRCLDCERTIPTERRRAVPNCVRCVHCQDAHEREVAKVFPKKAINSLVVDGEVKLSEIFSD